MLCQLCPKIVESSFQFSMVSISDSELATEAETAPAADSALG